MHRTHKQSTLGPAIQVASSESLSSLSLNNSNNPTDSQRTSQQSNNSGSNNFKTFKTCLEAGAKSTTTNTYKHVLNNDDNAGTQSQGYTSRTMPRNVVVHQQNFDQKPLNLPVNELFKRYELKRQATCNGGGSMTSSSGGCGSLSSLNSSSNRVVTTQVNVCSSPQLPPKIPDYFFKDEKEHRKLMSNNNKQLISLKVVESGCLTVDNI